MIKPKKIKLKQLVGNTVTRQVFFHLPDQNTGYMQVQAGKLQLYVYWDAGKVTEASITAI